KKKKKKVKAILGARKLKNPRAQLAQLKAIYDRAKRQAAHVGSGGTMVSDTANGAHPQAGGGGPSPQAPQAAQVVGRPEVIRGLLAMEGVSQEDVTLLAANV
ncbi:MAG: hypothetical protein ACK56I_21055, partial [bacterium]